MTIRKFTLLYAAALLAMVPAPRLIGYQHAFDLIKPTYNYGAPEPYRKPREWTPKEIEGLRARISAAGRIRPRIYRHPEDRPHHAGWRA